MTTIGVKLIAHNRSFGAVAHTPKAIRCFIKQLRRRRGSARSGSAFAMEAGGPGRLQTTRCPTSGAWTSDSRLGLPFFRRRSHMFRIAISLVVFAALAAAGNPSLAAQTKTQAAGKPAAAGVVNINTASAAEI